MKVVTLFIFLLMILFLSVCSDNNDEKDNLHRKTEIEIIKDAKASKKVKLKYDFSRIKDLKYVFTNKIISDVEEIGKIKGKTSSEISVKVLSVDSTGKSKVEVRLEKLNGSVNFQGKDILNPNLENFQNKMFKLDVLPNGKIINIDKIDDFSHHLKDKTFIKLIEQNLFVLFPSSPVGTGDIWKLKRKFDIYLSGMELTLFEDSTYSYEGIENHNKEKCHLIRQNGTLNFTSDKYTTGVGTLDGKICFSTAKNKTLNYQLNQKIDFDIKNEDEDLTIHLIQQTNLLAE